MSQNRISIVRKDPDIMSPFPLKYATESTVVSDIVPSDERQTVLLDTYPHAGGHSHTLEIGPCADSIPKTSIIAISPNGKVIIGHRPRLIPVSGYMLGRAMEVLPIEKDQWEIVLNEGTHLYVKGINGLMARLDGKSADQTFPAWWEPGSILLLDDTNSHVMLWIGDRFVIDSVPSGTVEKDTSAMAVKIEVSDEDLFKTIPYRDTEWMLLDDIIPNKMKTVRIGFNRPLGNEITTIIVDPMDTFVPRGSMVCISADHQSIIGTRPAVAIPIQGPIVGQTGICMDVHLPKKVDGENPTISWVINEVTGDLIHLNTIVPGTWEYHSQTVRVTSDVTPNYWRAGDIVILDRDNAYILDWMRGEVKGKAVG